MCSNSTVDEALKALHGSDKIHFAINSQFIFFSKIVIPTKKPVYLADETTRKKWLQTIFNSLDSKFV